ncbi:MAG: 3-phosphoshikimate 1-carboxyvinyltransferase [Lachnospiraceae bacterium]|nr:3-phosphoshikimate 1-carboxyvinyltransferase [Lachnospiraceae bacterium]
MKIPLATSLRGELAVPGDKSISHRSVMLGAIAKGDTEVRGFLKSADCLATIECMRQMGVEIEEVKEENRYTGRQESVLVIHGKGLYGLSEPMGTLDAMNSGTTVRLLSGILAGQPFTTYITGDSSLRKRPMKRIITPLAQMGCRIEAENKNNCLPLEIHGDRLHAIHYSSSIASAQVKSCVLLAGLYADGPTTFFEPYLSRNHTELMLSAFGANVKAKVDPLTMQPGAIIYPGTDLRGQKIRVPGDISSAAYFIAGGLIVPNSEVHLHSVGINETRDGILRVAKAMGGNVITRNIRMEGREPVADIIVKTSDLKGTNIGGSLIPALIDELPVIAIMAACAKGDTQIYDAGELRVKESDRLTAIVMNLQKMGVGVEETEDGMVIHGNGGKKQTGRRTPGKLGYFRGATIDSQGDHRLAMAFSIAGLISDTQMDIRNAECVKISYPSFYRDIARLASPF